MYAQGKHTLHSTYKLHRHLGRRAYRAPETIFGARDYNPYAVDLWSLGVTCAEFFTALRFIPDDDSSEDSASVDENSEIEQNCLSPFINPPVSEFQRGVWVRDPLFDADKGSIGLAWSIFKTRGTPDESTWPVRMSHSVCEAMWTL